MSKGRVRQYRNSERAREFSTGEEVSKGSQLPATTAGDRLPALDTLITTGVPPTVVTQVQVINVGDHAAGLVEFETTNGSRRFRASCTCGWIAPVSRSQQDRAATDTRQHAMRPPTERWW